jgi:hypothetical protein
MQTFLKFLGLILIFIAVLILVYELLTGINNNSYLIASGVLLLAGLVLHVILNKKLM